MDDHPVRAEKPVYWVVNKPVGYLCTNDDPAGRPRAVDLLPHVEQRVYTVGRLDEASEHAHHASPSSTGPCQPSGQPCASHVCGA